MSNHFGWRHDTGEEIQCIACGETVARTEAREYDRYGDRWDRTDRDLEYLCKPCDADRCHQPREGLEAALVDIGAGELDREEFLSAVCTALDDERRGDHDR